MKTVILRVRWRKEQKVITTELLRVLLLLTFSIYNNTISSFPCLLAQRQRLVSVKSILSRPSQNQVQYNGTNSTSGSLEQELHQRQLFEYFLVVSLQKSKAGGHYLPEVTQQFPPKVRSRSRGVAGTMVDCCGNLVLKFVNKCFKN